MTCKVPGKIEETSLVFINNRESDCTPVLTTRVNFRNGIPKQFLLEGTHKESQYDTTFRPAQQNQDSGIHFRPYNEAGVDMGRKVAEEMIY